MKTTIKGFLILLCLFISLGNAFSKEIQVEYIKASELLPVFNPVIMDSLDVKKKAYDEKILLQTPIDFSLVRNSDKHLASDPEGEFSLPLSASNQKNPAQDKFIQLLSFYIDADRYCSASLSITGTDMFEVYIDGNKKKTKETKEDSLSKAKPITLDLTLEPQRYEVIIKRLAEINESNESTTKISLETKDKNEEAEIAFSTDGKRRITINDILEGKRLGSVSLSPSGDYFIMQTSEVLVGGKNIRRSELRELKTNRTIYRFPSDVSAKWMSDNKLIYSKKGLKENNLYLMDVKTFEETQIGEEISFDYYLISPDEKYLLLSKKEEIPADEGDLKRVYSLSDRSGGFRSRNTIYYYSLDTKMVERLTYGQTRLYPLDISPDSKKVLLMTSEEINDRPFSVEALYEMDLLTLKIDTLVTDHFLNGASYSPDGKQLLITAAPEAFNGLGENISEGMISNSFDTQAYLFDLNTKGITSITRDFYPNINNGEWSKYDNHIYFSVEDKDRQQIYRYDVRKKTFTHLDLPEDMIAAFSISDKNSTTIFRGESASNAYRLYSYDLKSGKSVLLADPFKERLEELDLVSISDWSFISSDSTKVDGRYYLPYGYQEGETYPMIVYYYGGTSPTSRIFESTYPFHTYSALGYVVLTLNPSGTTGYGQEYAARHVNAWGKYTADEIIEGTLKFCEEHAFVNKDKIGCIGASYGGFMTQYLLTQTDVFAAGISHAGISNIASYWGEGYWGYSYSSVASAFSYPWNNPDLYVQQSPLFQADKINTPLLLLHGTVDTNVPIGESIQMFNALRILGKEVEFIQVQGENHAIYDYKKRIAWNKTIHAWFARWLKDQPEWWEALYPNH